MLSSETQIKLNFSHFTFKNSTNHNSLHTKTSNIYEHETFNEKIMKLFHKQSSLE